jgi:hypothetical protein
MIRMRPAKYVYSEGRKGGTNLKFEHEETQQIHHHKEWSKLRYCNPNYTDEEGIPLMICI